MCVVKAMTDRDEREDRRFCYRREDSLQVRLEDSHAEDDRLQTSNTDFVRSHFGSSHFGSSHFGSSHFGTSFALPECFHPLVVPAMTNGSSTRSEDRKMYVPTLSELHRKHGRAKQFCPKTACNGSYCAHDVLRSHENGRPIACTKCSGTFAKPRLFSDDGSLVRPFGKGPRGGKAPAAKSTTERERHLEAQVKDLQQ